MGLASVVDAILIPIAMRKTGVFQGFIVLRDLICRMAKRTLFFVCNGLVGAFLTLAGHCVADAFGYAVSDSMSGIDQDFIDSSLEESFEWVLD